MRARAEGASASSIDGVEAELDYRLDDAGQITILHTGVPPAIGGRGIAGELVRTALDWARAEGLKVHLACAYSKAWVAKHPEYEPRLCHRLNWAGMRLNKFISDTGACSRREADRLIAEGRVQVNGVRARVGAEVGEEDTVLVDGQPAERPRRGGARQAAARLHRAQQAARASPARPKPA